MTQQNLALPAPMRKRSENENKIRMWLFGITDSSELIYVNKVAQVLDKCGIDIEALSVN